MVHPYLRRRNHEEPVDYPSEAVKSVLERTLGVPLFQEQAMKLAVVAAGFTPGEADQLRRAMGAWRKTGVMEKFRQQMLAGMRANGYTEEFAERLFRQIQGFGEYGFPESHAASFALLVYSSAWIKRYHPEVFLAALLNSQPMGFYAPAQLVSDARKHGVEIRPADVNHSDWDSTLERMEASSPSCADSQPSTLNPRPFAVRLGWSLISGLGREPISRLTETRARGGFTSCLDFVRRTKLSSAILMKLAHADTFRSLGLTRRDALWRALAPREQGTLFDGLEDEPTVALPSMSSQQEMVADYQSSGLSLRSHPLSFLREELRRRNVVTTADLAVLEPDRRYRLAGLVLLRQRPGTAKGITFVTLEDETGTANLVIHPGTWERFHRVARHAGAWIVRGILERHENIIHLIVDRLESLAQERVSVTSKSRDFR
jgi:error-prone DNA polymerase